ncbi:MAG TPA: hydroxymethylglutaryl-CoA lyase [Conexibacter sp.]|nr:hydroxymethylglutaryl-CoA lyase [Conexibacter sp.]
MISICEVGPRDGLQNERVVLTPQQRATLVSRLARAGLRRIEAVSFVHPELVPAMAGAEEVLRLVATPEAVQLTGLVLNVRGYERLARTALREARFAFGASETFNQRNAGRSVDDAMRDAEEIVRRARAGGRRASVTVATAFGCPYEGRVRPARVIALAERIAALGVDELVLADTIGVAVPSQVRELMAAVAGLGPVPGLHLHNTRNTGYANVIAALEAGVEVIDASVGGAGGCPFAPGATGNVATEDVAYLLEREGVPTGIDLDELKETARWLGDALGHELDGRLHRTPPWWPSDEDEDAQGDDTAPAGTTPRAFTVHGDAAELYEIPNLPFVPAIRAPAGGDLVFVAGAAGSPWGEDTASDLRSEAHRAFRRMRHSLELAGATVADVVQATYHLTDIASDWPTVVEVMREHFGDHLPTSTAVEVARLVPAGLRIEVTVVAVVRADG